MWRVGKVVALRDETTSARTIALNVPDWPGHVAGQGSIANFEPAA